MKLPAKLRLAALVALVAALGVAGSVAATASAADGKTFVMLQDDIAPGLDVDGANSSNYTVHQVLNSTMEGLVAYPTTTKDGIMVPNFKVSASGLAPRLATSWSNKGLVWTFKLRQGVKSCAGNTFSADDVVYSFARAKSVSYASPVSWFLGNIGGVLTLDPLVSKAPDAKELKGEVKKIDANTVQITQFEATDQFPRVLEIFALYPYDSVDMKKHATATDPWSHKYADTVNAPGFGPYCIKSWQKGSQINLSANPNYYGGQPQFSSIVMRKVPAASNRVAAIKAGSADGTLELTANDIADIRKTAADKTTVLSWYNNEILALGLNNAIAPWNLPKNALLRQAVAYVLPIDSIVKLDYLGDAKPWYGLIESPFYGYKPIQTYAKTNVAKAKALLAQAGFPGGKGLDKYAAGLTLYYVQERSGVLEPIANRIKTALAEIGVTITLNPITNTEYNDRELTKFDMPMFMRDKVRPFGPDVGYTALLFYVAKKNGGLVNAGNYSNPAFDALFFKSQNTAGAARLALLGQMQTILMQDLPLVPIVERPSQLVVRKGISCWFGKTDNTTEFQYLRADGKACTAPVSK